MHKPVGRYLNDDGSFVRTAAENKGPSQDWLISGSEIINRFTNKALETGTMQNVFSSAKNGANCVIQPGGSMRDAEVIAAADERGVAMVFSGVRHFRHWLQGFENLTRCADRLGDVLRSVCAADKASFIKCGRNVHAAV